MRKALLVLTIVALMSSLSFGWGREGHQVIATVAEDHLNETTINYIKNLPMTEKGKKSEFLGVIGEKAETTFSFEVITTPLEYWLMTTYSRDKDLRKYWLRKYATGGLQASYALLADKYPHGTAGLETLPEENEPDFWGQTEADLNLTDPSTLEMEEVLTA